MTATEGRLSKAVKLCFGFIGEMLRELDAFGRFWMVLGLVVLVIAARMSYKFGSDVSPDHAAFLAVLTVVAAFGPLAAEILWQRGRKPMAVVTALICAPLLGIEFYSHAGYTAGLRGSNIETATVQNTKFDGAQDDVKATRASLLLWQKQLADLQAQAPWAATVTADALRGEVKNLDDKIAAEAAGGRGGRKAGCKAECEKLKDQRSAVAQRIAAVEQMADLKSRIDATQRIVDAAREKADHTEHKSSAVAHQNQSLKKWVALAFNGTTKVSDLQAEAAEQSANLAMAIAGTGLPAFALFIAGLFRRLPDPVDTRPQPMPSPMPAPFGGHIVHTTELIRDEALKRWAGSPEVRKLTLAA